MGRRSLPSVVLVAGLALLLAACQLRADVDVRVDADGGGAFALALEADEALDAEARAAGLDLGAYLEAAVADLEGWDVDVDDRRVRLATDVEDPGAMARTTAALADALEGPELRPLEPFEVTVTDQRVRVESGAGLELTPAVADLGLEPDEALDLLADGVTYTVTVEMPGEVLEHNADRREERRLRWEVPAGARTVIVAEAERPQPTAWLLPAALAAVGVLVLLAVLATWWRRRRRTRRHRFAV